MFRPALFSLILATGAVLHSGSVAAQVDEAPNIPPPNIPPHDSVAPAFPQTGNVAELDELFQELSNEANHAGAQRIARKIWGVLSDSGSDTINLLMQWTTRAIREENYALAGDLLTQVTTLRPDYAEGWNRSATVHFLKKEFGKSLADIERTLQLEPRHFGAMSGLASILQRTQQHQRALEAWYNVLAIYPANEDAQKAVIELEEKLAGEAI